MTPRVPPQSPCSLLTTRPRRAGAFTLIELLVVVTIIAVVVGITLPALGGARESARRLKCLTNLKGFGVAFQLYMNDNKDLLPYVLPFYDHGFPENPNDPQLLSVLEGYLDVQIPYYDEAGRLVVGDPFLCPSDDDEDAGRETGLSYEYWAGGLMLLREIFAGDPYPQRTVSRFYEYNPRFPVMADARPWHDGGKFDENALYFGDWRADWLELDPEEEGGFPGGG